MKEVITHIPIKKGTKPQISNNVQNRNESLLKIRSANDCIKDAHNRPNPKMLFSELWFEEELCILFADTNVGKSILCVQIVNSITKGIAINGFKFEADKQIVLYFDFEMSDKQFQKRYSNNYQNSYYFDNNFIRIEIDSNCVDYDDFETRLFADLEKSIDKYKAKILVIDNLTYLKTQATETAKEALPLMKKLKELKIKYCLSLLVLAHTPKRDMTKPITHNDLAGSKHLSNFADSIFTIGVSSSDKNVRYIKQIKTRSSEHIYDANNVILCTIEHDFNFLQFKFFGYGIENEHLKQQSINSNSELEQAIIELNEKDKSITIREIARQLNTNPMRVSRVLNKAKEV